MLKMHAEKVGGRGAAVWRVLPRLAASGRAHVNNPLSANSNSFIQGQTMVDEHGRGVAV